MQVVQHLKPQLRFPERLFMPSVRIGLSLKTESTTTLTNLAEQPS